MSKVKIDLATKVKKTSMKKKKMTSRRAVMRAISGVSWALISFLM